MTIVLGGRPISAVQILDFANQSAYEVHLCLAENGYDYQNLKRNYSCDAKTCDRIFDLASDAKRELTDRIVEIGNSIQTTKKLPAEKLLKKGLRMFGEYYPAHHIVEQYCKEHGIPVPELKSENDT